MCYFFFRVCGVATAVGLCLCQFQSITLLIHAQIMPLLLGLYLDQIRFNKHIKMWTLVDLSYPVSCDIAYSCEKHVQTIECIVPKCAQITWWLLWYVMMLLCSRSRWYRVGGCLYVVAALHKQKKNRSSFFLSSFLSETRSDL